MARGGLGPARRGAAPEPRARARARPALPLEIAVESRGDATVAQRRIPRASDNARALKTRSH